jgi:hypothetical protein
MASAPRPGIGKRNKENEQAQQVLRITVKGNAYSFCPNNLPFDDQIAVRKACGGLPFSAFWGGELTVSVDSLQIMLWLARRASGEPTLRLETVLEEWPEDLNPDDFEIALDDPEENDDDPE